MIKRSFLALSQPRLTHDLLEPDPKPPEEVSLPAGLTLLIGEAVDSTRQPLIKSGDAVKKGEKLKLYGDSTDYAVSPVAGTIKALDVFPDNAGNNGTSISIEVDSPRTAEEGVQPLPAEDLATAADYLQCLPGAPAFDVLANGKINTIVINCVDTDLLCTTNQYVGLTHADALKEGVTLLKKMTKVPKICIAVPKGLNLAATYDNFQVINIDDTFPSALPAMIMKDHLSMVLPAGQTPEDAGVCFIQAEAVVSMVDAFKTKEPVFEKTFTLLGKDGSPRRVRATIGTPIGAILTKFSITINEQDRLILGGPMRGFATFSTDHPVTPDLDMIMIQDADIIPELSNNACVNCGKCVRICPANIPVNLLVRYLEADEYEEAAERFDLESCIECGLCAYVCTARIPVYQYIRLGKQELLKLRAADA